jgi:hypothetical protein
MRGDELKSLVQQKYNEGKDSEEVFKEINDLKESQIILKNNDKEIKQLKRIKNNLEEENQKKKKRYLICSLS